MKKIFLAIAVISMAASFTPTESKAQISWKKDKTITTADTTVFDNVGSNVMSISYTYLESSGTTAGKVYFEGTNLAGAWELLDSLVLADVGTLQKKTVLITATSYKDYRLRNTNTSSATGVINAMVFRRPDEHR